MLPGAGGVKRRRQHPGEPEFEEEVTKRGRVENKDIRRQPWKRILWRLSSERMTTQFHFS